MSRSDLLEFCQRFAADSERTKNFPAGGGANRRLLVLGLCCWTNSQTDTWIKMRSKLHDESTNEGQLVSKHDQHRDCCFDVDPEKTPSPFRFRGRQTSTHGYSILGGSLKSKICWHCTEFLACVVCVPAKACFRELCCFYFQDVFPVHYSAFEMSDFVGLIALSICKKICLKSFSKLRT